MSNYCIITTINKPTKAIEELYKRFRNNLIIVGDAKTPLDWNYFGLQPIRLSDKLYAPCSHYARKNLGYLLAIKNKAEYIYDTDDDNIPNDNWKVRELNTQANVSISEGWYNVYDLFSGKFIWPRGFSLSHLEYFPSCGKVRNVRSSIQQGLADGDPDVDAIWRMTRGKPQEFEVNKSVYLKQNTWCPFNSQSTWWFPAAYPLLYLPVHATFRMTDIWRSFVAQRCLWEIGEGVTFHSPSEVFQDRNEHNLLKDFEDEIPGYLHNPTIVEILSDLTLKEGEGFICENMLSCYEALVENNILHQREILSVKQWIKDYEDATTTI